VLYGLHIGTHAVLGPIIREGEGDKQLIARRPPVSTQEKYEARGMAASSPWLTTRVRGNVPFTTPVAPFVDYIRWPCARAQRIEL
jgi:hypothetical protein